MFYSRDKNSDTSPTRNTPKRVLSKFNSFKMGSSMFKSMSQAEVSDYYYPKLVLKIRI